ncbi:MAG: hypothetical protein HOQ03_12155, partial [Thermoleophilia bacterium]|nr:hypothetical protein [Thermoleophilia bacterium]
GTTADPLDVEVDVDERALPDGVVEWVRNQPDALVYQFQLSAAPVASGRPAVSDVEIRLAGDPDVVRRRDHHTTAWERRQRDALRMKDHVIGLQAEATTAQARVQRLQKRVGRMRESLEELRAAQREKDAEIERLRRRGVVGFARRVKRRLVD